MTPDEFEDGIEAKADRAWALARIKAEMAAQDVKWGEQNHPDGTGPTLSALGRRDAAIADVDEAAKRGDLTWQQILDEEVAEAGCEEGDGALLTELFQVAAVATQWAMAIRRRRRAAPKGVV